MKTTANTHANELRKVREYIRQELIGKNVRAYIIKHGTWRKVLDYTIASISFNHGMCMLHDADMQANIVNLENIDARELAQAKHVERYGYDKSHNEYFTEYYEIN